MPQQENGRRLMVAGIVLAVVLIVGLTLMLITGVFSS